MTPKEAVAAAMQANRDWMMTHVGIVSFILSECELENVGNDEYDNVILRNPVEARREAELADEQGATFQVALTLTIPRVLWDRTYGNALDAEGVTEWLRSALFIQSDHIEPTVTSIVEQGK